MRKTIRVRRQQIEELRRLRGKLRLGRDWKRLERLEVKDVRHTPRLPRRLYHP